MAICGLPPASGPVRGADHFRPRKEADLPGERELFGVDDGPSPFLKEIQNITLVDYRPYFAYSPQIESGRRFILQFGVRQE